MLSIGIVGLPNVGKSTLFNALVKNAQAEASNYPFCTIDPNVGVVEVPDVRLGKLTEISKSQKTVPTTIEFIDIAGLVKGAHKGEGLGNQFLSHIKETDAIAMVIRFFENPDIIHVDGQINPAEDIRTINLELILADLTLAEKTLERMQKNLKPGDNETKKKILILEKIKAGLEEEMPIWAIFPNIEDLEPICEFQFITSKPVLYIANVSEEMATIEPKELIEKYHLGEIIKNPDALIPISAKIESELGELNDADQKEFLESLNLKESGLNRLISAAYVTLGLITFFTSGEKETRAWTVVKNSTAPQAAGKIHTDFERGFIAADVIKYNDFVEHQGWQNCKEKGLIKTEGKTYIAQDGDVMLFRFNV
ncbi:MAG: redox-regulated ATPase YchF [Patescibacteria group bacterium]|nr:redox-regulated ATPase YchF [Patescibacteria group bacterium]